MGIIERFFGKREREASTTSGSFTLVANTSVNSSVSLQLLFPDKLSLEPAALTRSLRKCDRSMAHALCEIAATADGGRLGLAGWGDHVVRIVVSNAPMPADVVETCVQGAHYGPELKAKARAHRSHVILYYAGHESAALEQYVALAAVAAALSRHGAIVVLNEIAHASFPADVLARERDNMMEVLRSLPIPMLYGGFVKYDVEGARGTWMRTYGNHVLGLPDFAHLAEGHHEGQATFEMISNLISYLQSSGATFAPGHTMEIGPATFLKVRAPAPEEYFLESEGEMLVLEKVAKSATNRR